MPYTHKQYQPTQGPNNTSQSCVHQATREFIVDLVTAEINPALQKVIWFFSKCTLIKLCYSNKVQKYSLRLK